MDDCRHCGAASLSGKLASTGSKQARNVNTDVIGLTRLQPHFSTLSFQQPATYDNSPSESLVQTKMPAILIVGATRGLGASLVKLYAKDTNNYVFATARTSDTPANSVYRV